MQKELVKKTNAPAQSLDEDILVVKRSILFPDDSFNGIQTTNFNEMISLINKHKEFLPRACMEQDERYKQIIPYLIFQHKDRYFVMQRHSKASEQRLKNMFSLGIGGHIRKEDMKTNSIFDWAQREFHEEVSYSGSFEIKAIGIINDDTMAVGRVHIGLALLLIGDSADIFVKSELKSGTLMTKEECLQYKERMETWSQCALEVLIHKND